MLTLYLVAALLYRSLHLSVLCCTSVSFSSSVFFCMCLYMPAFACDNIHVLFAMEQQSFEVFGPVPYSEAGSIYTVIISSQSTCFLCAQHWFRGAERRRRLQSFLGIVSRTFCKTFTFVIPLLMSSKFIFHLSRHEMLSSQILCILAWKDLLCTMSLVSNDASNVSKADCNTACLVCVFIMCTQQPITGLHLLM